MARSLQRKKGLSSAATIRNHYARNNRVPAIHVEVHALSFLKAAEVSCHLRLLHGLALQFVQVFDELNARVVFAMDESLFSHLQVQFVQSCFGQQPPGKFKENKRKDTFRSGLFLSLTL